MPKAKIGVIPCNLATRIADFREVVYGAGSANSGNPLSSLISFGAACAGGIGSGNAGLISTEGGGAGGAA